MRARAMVVVVALTVMSSCVVDHCELFPEHCGIQCSGLPSLAVGGEYAFTPAVAGSGEYVDWEIQSLPLGLSLDPVSGEISGQPVEPGDFALGIRVTDELRQLAFEAECDLEINPRLSSLDLRDSGLPCLTVETTREELFAMLEGGDGSEPSCRVLDNGSPACPISDGYGRMPAGITFDPETCTHSGVLTESALGTWAWMVEIEQSGAKVSVPFCATNMGEAYHDISLLVDGAAMDPLAPALYLYDSAGSLDFGSGFEWTVTNPADCTGCVSFGYTLAATCSPFDAAMITSESTPTADGFSHTLMASSATAPDAFFQANPFVAAFDFTYCTSTVAADCMPGTSEFNANAQTLLHLSVLGYPN